MKLNLPRRSKLRLPTRIRQPLVAPEGLNQIWALDFMSDALYGGRAFRTLNFLDEGNRQALGIEVAHSIPSLRVIRVMEQLIEMHGKPKALRVDNGPELTAIAFTEWCANRGIEIRFIQPGKPDQNAFIERFNKTYRDEVLDAYVFESIEQVREVTETWLPEYNEERPHDRRSCRGQYQPGSLLLNCVLDGEAYAATRGHSPRMAAPKHRVTLGSECPLSRLKSKAPRKTSRAPRRLAEPSGEQDDSQSEPRPASGIFLGCRKSDPSSSQDVRRSDRCHATAHRD